MVVVEGPASEVATKVFKNKYLFKLILKHMPIFSLKGSKLTTGWGVGWRDAFILMLTADSGSRQGTCWSFTRIKHLSTGFIARFGIRMGKNTSTPNYSVSADGMAFVIQNSKYGPGAYQTESGGAHCGYGGIDNSIAIEFNTYYNQDCNDPNGNHISLHTNGTQPNSAHHDYSLGHATPSVQMNDYRLHHVILTYNPHVEGGGEMSVNFDGADLLKVKVNIAELLRLENNDEAYVGFTAATGYYHQEHLVHYCIMHRLT
ncbi:hypothetical protein SAMD00019534_065930 [Acytostelium subglobosum LB1]|uniref:hypothetical protein n=1 Tax=Acytostelium subglobosum LB1 TaxID=1410327 RepID=UPI000644DFE7|nr:hypothetical protein SAMD00019534_065930 [Acytostelium subglobosum LB1]GAM23418.1 hypothetical protein SAMD00019534_065930 [Acytostelium subglobosum LB1]|eukprot:XP_012753867.1 hypothetical protein SAMD00019534_065930 [Acytostelium subglobosum LB1]